MVLPNFHSHSPFPPRRLFICFYLSLIEFIQFSNSHTPPARCHNEVESWEMWNEKSFAFFIFSVLLARTKIEIGNRLVRWWWRRWWRRRAFPASRSHTIVQYSKFHTPHSNNLDSSPRSLTSLIPPRRHHLLTKACILLIFIDLSFGKMFKVSWKSDKLLS